MARQLGLGEEEDSGIKGKRKRKGSEKKVGNKKTANERFNRGYRILRVIPSLFLPSFLPSFLSFFLSFFPFFFFLLFFFFLSYLYPECN